MKNFTMNLNGRLTPADQAKVSILDRSYLYGDSLYEVVRTYQGRFFQMDEHLDRLAASAKLCRMPLGQDLSEYRKAMEATVEAHRQSSPEAKDQDVYCRLIISRGQGKIGFAESCLETATQYAIIVSSIQGFLPQNFEAGIKLTISSRIRNDRRALDPAMKSGNYLNNLLAHLEAKDDDFDDAILCNHEGFLTEGTTFNLFYVRNGVVATPPLDVGILDGLTRRFIIELCREEGIEFREVLFPPARLLQADEVFISSTLKEVLPVTQIQEQKYSVGPITRQLKQAFTRKVENWLKS